MPPAVSVEPIDDGLLRTRGADVDIAFRMRGSGPAVVLLHGTSANHAVWEPVGDALAGRATVVALDQRGHGRSDKPATGYTGPDFADDVVTVLDALGLERAVVAGHSLGGRNAWLAAARHPDRVSGVVVVDYTPYVEASVLDELAVRVAGGFRAFADQAEIEAYLRDRYPRILPGAVERRARWGYRQQDDGTWAPYADPEAMRQLIEGFRTPWDAEFRAVRSPMTHLRGAGSTILSEAAWSAAMADRPADRWVVVDEADHYIPEEFPDLIVAELDRVLGN
ncbi:alpha/beta fold hydrolase [Herbiconiux ginsengi]|uniref:Pimeloyl-ACP methyl ester carboxylesterase n=1 Tax=Herbiconiux ginsengi TaxID=381665 RepID=A0A1H3RI29_9MICO|nr:alpha/beta hydrolase [Herbiconiux ginsengi]SDZ24878.1 Pimeloyl-ACP methyl ester carboxylesterase [Herbiconiux ginsengi]